jgi:membrane protein
VFGEVQSAMNAIWKAKPRSSTLSRLVRATGEPGPGRHLRLPAHRFAGGECRPASPAKYLKGLFPGADVPLQVFDFLASTVIISGLFAAIYKVLPDKPITWRDVATGALATTLLFEGGKYLIALYVGQSNVASSYGAAGALIVLLLWIYYTAHIFSAGCRVHSRLRQTPWKPRRTRHPGQRARATHPLDSAVAQGKRCHRPG